MPSTPAAKRSPIKQPSRPQAGESLMHQRNMRLLDIAYFVFLPAIFIMLAAFEWLRYWFRVPVSPWILTITALVVATYSAIRGRRIWRGLAALELGLRGERTVGQRLEELRAMGYHVFHDLCEDAWNIDHVLVGPGGVFAVETKTISKPNDHDAKVTHDGEKLLVDGFELDRDPLKQATAAARHVQKVLREQTGQDVKVQAVVVFPGWFVEGTSRSADVYVSNDNYLMKRFENEGGRQVLDPRDVDLYAAGIDRYQRRT